MGTTRYKIAEQVLSLLKGGSPSVASSVRMPAVMEAVGQAVNKLLKTDYYTTHIGGDEIIPNGYVVGVYENVSVEKHRGVSRSPLPAFPVKLINNVGLFQINKPGCPNDPFIPIPTGNVALIRSEPMISDLFDQIGYYQSGMHAIYTKDLQAKGIGKVDMMLVVMDVGSYSDHQPLPIPADMEFDAIRVTYEIFTGQAFPDKHIDASAENKNVRS